MNSIEKSAYLEALKNSIGWKVYIEEVIGTKQDVTRGKWGRVLLSLRNKKKEETLRNTLGILEGLEYAVSGIDEVIRELNSHNPETGGKEE